MSDEPEEVDEWWLSMGLDHPPMESDYPVQENWFKDGVHFECTACGKCCQVPQGIIAEADAFASPGAAIDEEEVAALAAHVKLPELEFREKYVVLTRYGNQALAMPDGACAFYDKNTKLCKVHEARPSHCRTFPFWPLKMGAKVFWNATKEQCEGINEGPLITETEILAKMSTLKPSVRPNWRAKTPAPNAAKPPAAV